MLVIFLISKTQRTIEKFIGISEKWEPPPSWEMSLWEFIGNYMQKELIFATFLNFYGFEK